MAWNAVALVAIGAVAGGAIGATVGRRVPPQLLRTLVIVLGVAVAVRLILT